MEDLLNNTQLKVASIRRTPDTIVNLQPLLVKEKVVKKKQINKMKRNVAQSPFGQLSSKITTNSEYNNNANTKAIAWQQQLISRRNTDRRVVGGTGDTNNNNNIPSVIFCDNRPQRKTESDNNNDVGRNKLSIPNISSSSSSGSSSTAASIIPERQLIPHKSRSSIETYPLRVVDQLRIVDKVSNNGRGSLQFTAGFECKHCCGMKRFISFPQTREDVEKELMNFRRHLDKCNGIDLDLQDYLRWIENGYRYHCRIETKGYFRLKKSLEDATTLVSRRLDEEETKGRDNLAKAKKERLSKKRKQTHSILESVGSL